MAEWDEKREKLLHTAREVLAQYGFRKTTLEDIAGKAGVGKATIYYYFDSKEKIFSDVIAHESGLLVDALKKAVQGIDKPGDQIIAFVKTRYEHITNLRNLYNVSREVVREILPLVQEEREKFRENELSLLTKIIEEGIRRDDFKQCDAELLALTIISSLRGLTETFMMYSKDDRIAKGMDELISLFMNGLNVR